ncbi:TetR/AcrR family transcriptional regulator [Bifidobacterium eulemuris]|uniref:AcrR family transcriptional regulator n=1 Tax=Bifidobacterium eulemuris TaxID=1765219 RepID=A0A261GDF4_9BIFI|nr:TetR/AcrR family transcriptional regulator [Bifidobacterium eulemuris]OZG69437.1 AcrR family transcriptional regulator [Bifidobacterium eulemuris]QOL32197.1 TetR/AcrR family transcriptional regulator [Bifidobacterium eulemuris]
MSAKTFTESRRTRYTRQAMRDALMELLADRSLAQISVKQLCERADVNRSTFYAHYDSLEDLLHDIEDDTIAWVRGALDQLLNQSDQAGIEHIIARICQYIADNRNHLQVLMSPKADLGFQQQLLGLIYSRRDVASQLQPYSDDPAEAEMRMRFAVSGSIGLLQYWLATDLAAPADTIARTICTMTMPSAS